MRTEHFSLRWPGLFLVLALLSVTTACWKAPVEPPDSPVRAYLKGVVDALDQGKTRQATEMLLARKIDDEAWQRAQKALFESHSASARAAAEACAQNLAMLQATLELYRGDEERGAGHMPEKLSDLIGTGGLTALPTCPAARRDTYSAGYKQPRTSPPYRLSCSGRHHAAAGLKAGFPALDPRYGTLMAEDETLSWWPAKTRYEVGDVRRSGSRYEVTLREVGPAASPRPSSDAAATEAHLVLEKNGNGYRLVTGTPLDKEGSVGLLVTAYLDCASHPVVAATSRADCERDLRRIATALESFSSDHGGRYPARLSELVPHYAWRVPGVHAQGPNASSPTYRVSPDGEGYELSCPAHPDLRLSNRPGSGRASEEPPATPSSTRASPQAHLGATP